MVAGERVLAASTSHKPDKLALSSLPLGEIAIEVVYDSNQNGMIDPTDLNLLEPRSTQIQLSSSQVVTLNVEYW